MEVFEFQHPWALLLLFLLPFLIYLHIKKKRKDTAVIISSLKPFEATNDWLGKLKPLLFVLRLTIIGLMIIALARPQMVKTNTSVKSEKGIDIIMTVDTSLSMLAKDLKPNRLEALKEVAEKFIQSRPTDRIGLVDYSGEAVLKVPLTTDHEVVVREIHNLETGVLSDGTAIGVGLATTINHLKNSEAKSKIIILLTDGVEEIDYRNGLLYVSPQEAAEIAKRHEIKVYTIGIGTMGLAPFPSRRNILTGEIIYTLEKHELDEPMMKEIANVTGGRYFRATDNHTLDEIYKEINRLEKTDINEIKYYRYTELFGKYLGWAMVLLIIELILRKTIFKEIN